MAQTKLKSKAENGPDSSIYSSSQLGRAAIAMVSGSCPADISFCPQPREARKPKFQLCSIKYQEMDNESERSLKHMLLCFGGPALSR